MNVHDSERLSGLLEDAGLRPAAPGERRPTSSCSTPARCGRTPTTSSTATSATSRRSRPRTRACRSPSAAAWRRRTAATIVRAGAVGRRRLRHPQHRLAAGAARAGPAQRGGAGRDPRVARGLPVDAADQARVGVRRAGCRSRSAATTPARSASCPALRGKEKDRRPGDILAEVEALVAEGVIEVTLLGQNVNSYGVEFGDRQAFAQAAARLRRRSTGLERVRFTSPHPRGVHRRRHRGDGRDAERDAAAAHAAAVRLGPGAQGDAPLLPAASGSSASSTGSAPRCPTPRSPPTSSSASPARPRRTSQETLDVVAAGPVRRRLHLPVLQAPRHAGRRRWPTRCPRRSCRSATSGWSRCRTRSPGRRTRRWSAATVELLVAEGEGRKDAATHRLSGRARDNRLVHFAAPATPSVRARRHGRPSRSPTPRRTTWSPTARCSRTAAPGPATPCEAGTRADDARASCWACRGRRPAPLRPPSRSGCGRPATRAGLGWSVRSTALWQRAGLLGLGQPLPAGGQVGLGLARSAARRRRPRPWPAAPRPW